MLYRPDYDRYRDALYWQGACIDDTVLFYQHYLQAVNDQGAHTREALIRIETIRQGGRCLPAPALGVQDYIDGGCSFLDLGDGTALDCRTGLQWMRCSFGQRWWCRFCVGVFEYYTFDNAIYQIEQFNRAGGCAGHKDWRLPTLKELCSIVAWPAAGLVNDVGGVGLCEAIDRRIFPHCSTYWYWSSSAPACTDSHAWALSFHHGWIERMEKRGDRCIVRLVRGGC